VELLAKSPHIIGTSEQANIVTGEEATIGTAAR
jgi:hypothetical protein